MWYQQGIFQQSHTLLVALCREFHLYCCHRDAWLDNAQTFWVLHVPEVGMEWSALAKGWASFAPQTYMYFELIQMIHKVCLNNGSCSCSPGYSGPTCSWVGTIICSITENHKGYLPQIFHYCLLKTMLTLSAYSRAASFGYRTCCYIHKCKSVHSALYYMNMNKQIDCISLLHLAPCCDII